MHNRAFYVAQSQPSLTRPRLHTDSEQRLAETDQRSALSYAQAEELTEALNELATKVEAAPELIDLDEPSTAHHIDHLRRAVAKPVDEIAIPRTRSKQ